MGESGFFWPNTENFLLLTQIRILSKFLISLSKIHTSPPKKNSSNLNESQELSGPLPKQLKSVKILKTFTHAVIYCYILFINIFDCKNSL